MARAKLLLRLLAAPPLQSPSVRSTAADRCSSHPSQSLSSRPLPNTAAPLPPPFRDLCWPLAPACGPTRCSASRSPRPCARRTGVFLPFLPARAAPSHVARPANHRQFRQRHIRRNRVIPPCANHQLLHRPHAPLAQPV